MTGRAKAQIIFGHSLTHMVHSEDLAQQVQKQLEKPGTPYM